MFQYAVLQDILYANKMLFKFGKVAFPPCSFCKLHNETIMHFFYECSIVKRIRNQLKSILSTNLIFSITMPHSAILGYWDLDTNEHLILNHLLTFFKMCIYNARITSYLNISHLVIYVKAIQDTEKKLCENDPKRRTKFNKIGENVLIN